MPSPGLQRRNAFQRGGSRLGPRRGPNRRAEQPTEQAQQPPPTHDQQPPSQSQQPSSGARPGARLVANANALGAPHGTQQPAHTTVTRQLSAGVSPRASAPANHTYPAAAAFDAADAAEGGGLPFFRFSGEAAA
eukprot:1085598-Prymnesium_polylepis.1